MLFDGLLHATIDGRKLNDETNQLYSNLIFNNGNQQKILNNLMEILSNFFINITDKSFDSNKSLFSVAKLIRFLKTIGRSTLKLLGNIVGFTKIPIDIVVTMLEFLINLSSWFKLLNLANIPIEGLSTFLHAIKGYTDDVGFLSYGINRHKLSELKDKQTSYNGGLAQDEIVLNAQLSVLTDYLGERLKLYDTEKIDFNEIVEYLQTIIDKSKDENINEYLNLFITCLNLVIEQNYTGLLVALDKLKNHMSKAEDVLNSQVLHPITDVLKSKYSNFNGLISIISEHIKKLEQIHYKNKSYTHESVIETYDAVVGDDPDHTRKIKKLNKLKLFIDATKLVIEDNAFNSLANFFSLRHIYLLELHVSLNRSSVSVMTRIKLKCLRKIYIS